MMNLKRKIRYNLAWVPNPIHRVLVRLIIGPFGWAHNQKKQTLLTRAIRATWRAL
jgi:hypothetical protein